MPGTSAYNREGQAQEIDVYVSQNLNSSNVQYSFRPQSDFFRRPHVLRTDGHHVWVGEIAESGGILWQLEIQSSGTADHKMNGPLDSSKSVGIGTHMGMGNSHGREGAMESGEPLDNNI